MNTYTLESFISFCDDMMIAEEGFNNDLTYNLHKFGKDSKHNILYITGYSGSGKTTLANSYLSDDTEVIHLDAYYEHPILGIPTSKDFDRWIYNNVPDFFKIRKNFDNYSMARYDVNDPNGKFYWNTMLKVLKETKNYAEYKFPNKKVIVEGIQLYDSFPANSDRKQFFRDMPVIIKKTNAFVSFKRRNERDNISSPLDTIKFGLQYLKDYPCDVRQLHTFKKDLDSCT